MKRMETTIRVQKQPIQLESFQKVKDKASINRTINKEEQKKLNFEKRRIKRTPGTLMEQKTFVKRNNLTKNTTKIPCDVLGIGLATHNKEDGVK